MIIYIFVTVFKNNNRLNINNWISNETAVLLFFLTYIQVICTRLEEQLCRIQSSTSIGIQYSISSLSYLFQLLTWWNTREEEKNIRKGEQNDITMV